MWEDDREVPEYRYIYTPMPKISGTNIVVFIFLVIVLALLVAGLIGKLTGGWDVQPQ